MASTRKDFTEEEIAILKTIPHVMDVSTYSIDIVYFIECRIIRPNHISTRR